MGGENNDNRQIILNRLKSKKYIRKEKNALLIWSCRNYNKNAFYLPIVINSLLDASENEIFESICCLFDESNIEIKKNNKLLTIFEEKVNLYSPEYLLDLYKKNRIKKKKKKKKKKKNSLKKKKKKKKS